MVLKVLSNLNDSMKKCFLCGLNNKCVKFQAKYQRVTAEGVAGLLNQGHNSRCPVAIRITTTWRSSEQYDKSKQDFEGFDGEKSSELNKQ